MYPAEPVLSSRSPSGRASREPYLAPDVLDAPPRWPPPALVPRPSGRPAPVRGPRASFDDPAGRLGRAPPEVGRPTPPPLAPPLRRAPAAGRAPARAGRPLEEESGRRGSFGIRDSILRAITGESGRLSHAPMRKRRRRPRRGVPVQKALDAPKGASSKKSGGDLLSQGVYPQVPSAQAVLTSVFGMGTGVTLPL